MNIHTHHHPRKRFGQNFLIDRGVVARIVAAIAPRLGDHLVEIGPGFGALTASLLPIVNRMDAIELDRDIIPHLAQVCANLGELTVYQSDALEFNFAELVKDQTPLRVVGNLPYNISTPLIFHLLEYIHLIKDMHFMLQREVVERMAAKPGTEEYGRLSVMVQYFCKVDNLFIVGPNAFNPPPKVESAIVRLTPHQKLPIVANNMAIFRQIVLDAFSQRRKMLHNSLKKWISVEKLSALNIDPNIRPEQLSVLDFVNISNQIESKQL